MRILFMADVPANPNSGAAGTEYHTIEALRALGHDVDTIWADALPRRIKHGNLHYLLELPLAYKRKMVEQLSGGRYDIVHINQPHGYLAAKTLARLNKKTAFIHRSHGFELRVEQDLRRWQKQHEGNERSPLRKAASHLMSRALSYNCRMIARYADGHIVSAAQCREFLCEKMGILGERVAVIPQAAPDCYLTRPLRGMEADRIKQVLYVGQFTLIKAPTILAEVMSRLASLDSDIRLTWIAAKEHHPQIRALLSGRARESVTLLDWMPQDELLEIYDRHGIFLFPSFFEGFGKVFLEAMSRGLCVVAADNGGARDVIAHGGNGMLAPTGCGETMTRHCVELIKNLPAAQQISREAVKTAQSYTWDRVAASTARFYQERLDAKTCYVARTA